MRFIATAFGAVLAATILTTGTAHAQMCADRSARQALELRVLQSELMVAALTCDQRDSYNAFVNGFKPFLKDRGRELRGFFAEAYGPTQGPQKLNNLVTRLANVASKGSLSQPTRAYCAQTAKRFQAVLSASPGRLVELAGAGANADAHGVSSCLEVATDDGTAASEQN